MDPGGGGDAEVAAGGGRLDGPGQGVEGLSGGAGPGPAANLTWRELVDRLSREESAQLQRSSVEEYALREGSSGAGKQRGGFGVRYRTRLLHGEATASFLMDHGRTGPHGLLGGEPGAMNEIRVSKPASSPNRRTSPRATATNCAPATGSRCSTPGGGGYGDPAERDPALVERDRRRYGNGIGRSHDT